MRDGDLIRPKSSWTCWPKYWIVHWSDQVIVAKRLSSLSSCEVKAKVFGLKGLVGLDLRGHLGALPYLSSVFCLVFSTHIFIASDNAEL